MFPSNNKKNFKQSNKRYIIIGQRCIVYIFNNLSNIHLNQQRNRQWHAELHDLFKFCLKQTVSTISYINISLTVEIHPL